MKAAIKFLVEILLFAALIALCVAIGNAPPGAADRVMFAAIGAAGSLALPVGGLLLLIDHLRVRRAGTRGE
jgi:hypothetical protein